MTASRGMKMEEADYALGYAEAELRRLTTQARLIDPITRRFLEGAGIRRGMRVLDIGSGAGDVAFLCRELVGPAGEVVGTDLAVASVERATQRARRANATGVSFRHGDAAELEFDAPFDAAVGRYVLQFMPDPARSLQRIARQLRPGGVIAFHEIDWAGARSVPPSPTYDRACELLSRTIAAAGAQVYLGTRLASVFNAAGLPSPTLRLESVIGSGPGALEAARLVTDLVETQLPAMEKHGIATAAEVDHPTLLERILAEVGATGTLIGRSEVGAWVAKPE